MTRGSHAPSLTTIARRALTELLAGMPAPVVLCAVSGGPDSMALLHVLALLRRPRGRTAPAFQLVACGVDHGLRAAARDELGLAEALAAAHGVPFSRRVVDVGMGANLQARARAARYDALLAEADRVGGPEALVATAHHADDRAETFLLRLTRGAGLHGLAVLPPREGRLVRPLLRARRRDVELHVARHGLPHARDPSNSDLRFARARVRAEILPGLLGLDPRFVEHVGAVCDELVALRRQASGAPATAELEGLGRRSRDALQRLARGDARKMAVQLPKQRTATYDPSVGRLVLHAPEAPAGPTDPAPCPGPARAPRKLP